MLYSFYGHEAMLRLVSIIHLASVCVRAFMADFNKQRRVQSGDMILHSMYNYVRLLSSQSYVTFDSYCAQWGGARKQLYSGDYMSAQLG